MSGGSRTTMRWGWRCMVLAACTAVLAPVERARADGAFVVEDADVAKPGSCKVESWGAAADNRDGMLVSNPACVFDLGRPVELSASFARFRDEGEMGTTMVPKGKTQIFESGKASAALIVGTAFDLL